MLCYWTSRKMLNILQIIILLTHMAAHPLMYLPSQSCVSGTSRSNECRRFPRFSFIYFLSSLFLALSTLLMDRCFIRFLFPKTQWHYMDPLCSPLTVLKLAFFRW
ncbi:hypothetical protein BDV23DRAFT_148550 [Aspergillus alliaceus]|uniref:Uncharacterized protein n=1 Tax=Petromyces alliaceus TaxID=209559 RepID=A0A5N7CJN5_PETAA|nr:uncharacterized protein BDW43DRAFT_289187 [Aspergillus alliaceus]KAB8229072.1 hypothetical protein BDW43DRAFT_289187 [Aspergillus alliaceus]KAE8394037.1 hypothetical protein BDV23DRAFT_148550 [Aspergillus alliaceus]